LTVFQASLKSDDEKKSNVLSDMIDSVRESLGVEAGSGVANEADDDHGDVSITSGVGVDQVIVVSTVSPHILVQTI
jgi:hypothetical protein